MERLLSTLQAMTLQRIDALRDGRHQEAMQIQEVQIDIDNKIQELEVLLLVEKRVAWLSNLFFKLSCVASIMLDIPTNAIGSASTFGV